MTLRVGIINYINTLPLFQGMWQQGSESNFEFYFGTPEELNIKLRNGELDLSLVSSAEYLRNKNAYILFSKYGVASRKKVMSTCFYSNLGDPSRSPLG